MMVMMPLMPVIDQARYAKKPDTRKNQIYEKTKYMKKKEGISPPF